MASHSASKACFWARLPLWAIFDLLATQPFSMRVLGPLLWLHDRVDNDLAETPAFRDADGDCVMPGNLRLFLVKLAAETGIDVDSRGIGLHSLRIARTGAWAAAMEDSSEDGFFSSARREADRQITGFTLDQLTGHSSSSGTAAYIRSEIARSLAADRAAATAVMAPIEILYQFNSDRSQSQQITVRLDSATGEYSPLDDTTILHNYGGVDSDDDDDEDVGDSSTVDDSDDGDQTGSVGSDSCTDSQRAGQTTPRAAPSSRPASVSPDGHMNYANQLGAMSVDSDGPFSDAESDPEHDGSSAIQQGQIAYRIDQLQSEIVGLRLYTGAWEAAERLKPGQRLASQSHLRWRSYLQGVASNRGVPSGEEREKSRALANSEA